MSGFNGIFYELRFDRHLHDLRQVDQSFVQYLTKYWLPIQRQWAVHAQTDFVHFGNRTNNRIENANGRIKKHTHHRDSLEVALQKIWCYSASVVNEYNLRTFYECDRRLLLDAEDWIRAVLNRLTIYAAKHVHKHLQLHPPTLTATDNDGIEVCFLVVLISSGECNRGRSVFHC